MAFLRNTARVQAAQVQFDEVQHGYEPPRLVRLGTLAQLTQGGDTTDQDDAFGGAGDEGSLG